MAEGGGDDFATSLNRIIAAKIAAMAAEAGMTTAEYLARHVATFGYLRGLFGSNEPMALAVGNDE